MSVQTTHAESHTLPTIICSTSFLVCSIVRKVVQDHLANIRKSAGAHKGNLGSVLHTSDKGTASHSSTAAGTHHGGQSRGGAGVRRVSRNHAVTQAADAMQANKMSLSPQAT